MDNKLECYKSVAIEFAEKIKELDSVAEVAIFASVAANDQYPSDVDVALFLNTPRDIPQIAKVKRQLQGKTNGFDLFVFDVQRTFLGNICFRRECPGRSVECAYCGDIPFIQVREGLVCDPVRWFKTPVLVVFQRDDKSLLLTWQKQILKSLGRDMPEPYPVREGLIIKCWECGDRFEFEHEKMGFKNPKHCRKCRDARDERKYDEFETA